MYALKKYLFPTSASLHLHETIRVDKILEESYSLLVFLFEKYLCMHVHWENPSSCTLMIYLLCYIYPWDTESKRYSNSCSLIPSGPSGRKSTEWGRTTFPFLNKYLCEHSSEQGRPGPCALHLHGQAVDHPLLSTCCHVCYSEKQLSTSWGQGTCLFTYLEHSLHGTHKTE